MRQKRGCRCDTPGNGKLFESLRPPLCCKGGYLPIFLWNNRLTERYVCSVSSLQESSAPMLSRRIVIVSLLTLASATPGFAYNHAHRGPTSPGLFKHRSSKATPKPAGPRAIESQRATEIQSALIKGGYMTGTPSGHWDSDSQVAMQKLQASKGWQTKLTPDSRALILLGLGPQQQRGEDSGLASNRDGAQLTTPSDVVKSTSPSGYSIASLNK